MKEFSKVHPVWMMKQLRKQKKTHATSRPTQRNGSEELGNCRHCAVCSLPSQSTAWLQVGNPCSNSCTADAWTAPRPPLHPQPGSCRITESFELEGTLEGHLVQLPCNEQGQIFFHSLIYLSLFLFLQPNLCTYIYIFLTKGTFMLFAPLAQRGIFH